MPSKEEIIAGIREVEVRLNGLLPAIETNLSQPLPEGTWDIHDALCHIAADVPAVPRWLARFEALEKGTSSRPPGFSVDDFNQQNIDSRKGKPLEAVVQEIRDGLNSDIDALAGIDDALLKREVPNFRGEMTEASSMLSFSTGRHNHIHLDDIENALAAATGSPPR